MNFWSTDTVNERERFSFWRELVCKMVFSISPESPHENFSGRITAWNSGSLRFATCETNGYANIRTRRDISSAPADHYTIYLQLRGQTLMEQCDQSFAFEKNDFFISDGREPYRAALSDDGFRAMVVVPRTMIDWRAPWLCRRPLSKLDPNSPYVDLARRHFVHLVSGDVNEIETSLLTDNVCNLLALAGATDIPPNRLRPELQMTALLAFCRQHLHYPGLSPQFVAENFGISVRTLHLRFGTLGQTFGRWLLETRLDACRKALRDPLQDNRTISEIAYSCGFNDLSHFNKAFRARFGMTPGEWRSELSLNTQ
ncbi:MAG TPA: helix-turn-helix domain-containing protein [Pseudolabrys sp.]|nr:helix-turn-helix domain-containing protein [Pseudolabrys sp.]